jgi:hypothetical protein
MFGEQGIEPLAQRLDLATEQLDLLRLRIE